MAREPQRIDQERRQRIDKWLWCARVVKSRTLAAKLVEAGHVRLNGRRVTVPAREIGAGDILTISLERRVHVWRVLTTSDRRGPFSSASLLYEDIAEHETPCVSS